MSVRLAEAYDAIANAMIDAAQARSAGAGSAAAERLGLIEQGDGKPSQNHVWERREANEVLRFRWRWYDQSRPFSIQPDMNILSLELRQGDTVLRSFEQRFED